MSKQSNKNEHAPKVRSWYSVCGALVTDQPVPGIAEYRLTGEAAGFYGEHYLIAESMTEPAARKISELLGLDYCGAKLSALIDGAESGEANG